MINLLNVFITQGKDIHLRRVLAHFLDYINDQSFFNPNFKPAGIFLQNNKLTYEQQSNQILLTMRKFVEYQYYI